MDRGTERERVERVTTTTTASSGSAMQSGAERLATASSSGGIQLTGNESQRELEQLRARGLYHGPGADIADRRTEMRVEQYVKEDAPVVEEQIRRREIREVIPKVQREREVTEVRHAVLPIHDRVKEATTVSERQLAGISEREYRTQLREEELAKNRAIRDRLSHGYRQELDAEVEYRYAKPTVEEVVRPRIVREIHPVIQREIEKEHLEREYLPIRERVIEGPRVADEVEVLRPLSRDEWERSHGRALYEQSGWQYGAAADEYVRREYTSSRFDEYDRRASPAPVMPAPLPMRRGSASRPVVEERRTYYSEEPIGRSGGTSAYDMGGMARALEPEYDAGARSRYDSGIYSESAYAPETSRRHHGFLSGLGHSKRKSSSSSRRRHGIF